MTSAARTELLVFGFDGPLSGFEGRLVGALERAESGGAIRVRDVLFVGRDADSGDLAAVTVRGGAGGLVAALSEFRLDPARRGAATARAIAADPAIEDLAAALQPGSSIVGAVIEHAWEAALDDAVQRTGGRPLAREQLSPAGGGPTLAARTLDVVSPRPR